MYGKVSLPCYARETHQTEIYDTASLNRLFEGKGGSKIPKMRFWSKRDTKKGIKNNKYFTILSQDMFKMLVSPGNLTIRIVIT